MAMHSEISVGTYRTIFAALLVLTAVTVMVAFVDLGPLNNFMALGIATTKATLVLLYFMHLRYSPTLTRVAVGTGILFFVILVAFTMSDVVTRELMGLVDTFSRGSRH
jgi:cytochrome c oxidase subunit 4